MTKLDWVRISPAFFTIPLYYFTIWLFFPPPYNEGWFLGGSIVLLFLVVIALVIASMSWWIKALTARDGYGSRSQTWQRQALLHFIQYCKFKLGLIDE